MGDPTTSSAAQEIRIEPARPEDRATLAMTVPNTRYLAETGWSLVAVRGSNPMAPIIGMVILTRSYIDPAKACLGVHLSILEPWLEAGVLKRLLDPAMEHAREWGARRFRILEPLSQDSGLARGAVALGFEAADTFDSYQMDLRETAAQWRETLDLIQRRFTLEDDVEIVPMSEALAPGIARCWARFIGGDPEQHLDSVVRAVHGLGSIVDHRFSRVAVQDGRVVGLHLCSLKDQTLKVQALVVAPEHRLSGLQLRLFLENGTAALDAGATVQIYDAGRKQPDTRNMSTRTGATILESRVSFERALQAE
jgi:GNAT superfamily N-acetyltransferase